jgi:hypothetical protein
MLDDDYWPFSHTGKASKVRELIHHGKATIKL